MTCFSSNFHPCFIKDSQTPATFRSVMNEPNHTPPTDEKHIKLISQTSALLSRWSGPFVSLLSYGLILGLALTGISLMMISAMIGLFFNSELSSGFGFLTGGILLATGCGMILWKLTRALSLLYQIRQSEKTA